MRGLLLKDLYIVLRSYKYLLVVVGAYVAVMLASLDAEPNMVFIAYTGLFLGMIPTGTYMHDEQSRWTEYSLTLPYSRAVLASSKYVMGLLLGGGCAVLFVAIEAARAAVHGAFSPSEAATVAAVVFAAAVVPTAVSLPFMYALGSARGSIAYLLSIGVVAGGVMSVGIIKSGSIGGGDVTLLPAGAAAAVFAVAAAVYAVSWGIAVLCYRRRSF